MSENLDPPDWLLRQEGLTVEQWQTRKRRELRALQEALGAFHFGCAYCPGNPAQIRAIAKTVEQLILKLAALR